MAKEERQAAATGRPPRRNGIEVSELRATQRVLKNRPELARFRLRASNTWISGTHSTTAVGHYTGLGSEHSQTQDFFLHSDYPPPLTGDGEGPAPIESLMHAATGCLSASIALLAAQRGVNLTDLRVDVECVIDARRLLVGSETAPPPRLSFVVRVRASATDEAIRDITERAIEVSPVLSALHPSTTTLVMDTKEESQ